VSRERGKRGGGWKKKKKKRRRRRQHDDAAQVVLSEWFDDEGERPYPQVETTWCPPESSRSDVVCVKVLPS